MAGGLYSRLKVWIAKEDILHTDLNAEFDNVKANHKPDKIDDHSANVDQMKETFDPGSLNNENLPINLSEELKAMRRMFEKVHGKSVWYEPPSTSLETLNNAISTQARSNGVLSGKVDANNQPMFLETPNAVSLTLDIVATATPLKFKVEDQEFTIALDATLILPAGFGANNTCLLADTINSGDSLKFIGSRWSSAIKVKTVGSEIVSRTGKLSAFTFTNGADTEVFYGIFDGVSGNGEIRNCYRGYFFNESQAFVNAEITGTIQLLRLSYIFAKSSGTFTRNLSGNDPIVSGVEPTAPASNDYWYDLSEKKWKIFDGATFIDGGVSLIGITCQNSSTIVGSRSFDFDLPYRSDGEMELRKKSDTQVLSTQRLGLISVYGNTPHGQERDLNWDQATDHDTGVTADNDTAYFFYLTDEFVPKISYEPPYDRTGDLFGFYHPFKPWRCFGMGTTEAAATTYKNDIKSLCGNLPNASISSEKLMPYSIITNVTNRALPLQNIIKHAQITGVALAAGASSVVLTVFSTGRPIQVGINPLVSAGAAGGINKSGGVAIQSYLQINTNMDVPSWSRVCNILVNTLLNEGFETFYFLDVLNLEPGWRQYRIHNDATSTAGLVLEVDFFALEL